MRIKFSNGGDGLLKIRISNRKISLHNKFKIKKYNGFRDWRIILK